MRQLRGFEKKYLRGLAHSIKPVVFVGQKGVSAILIEVINEALDVHELIKIKFIEFKQKDQKEKLCGKIERSTESILVGMIGHIGIFYRPHADPLKRHIVLPKSCKTQDD
ncbi:MAG: YhbY family RNA-binding protein [Desulfobacteraceae bacterium]